MFKSIVILISIVWASLLLISWGGTTEPPVSQGPAVIQGNPTS